MKLHDLSPKGGIAHDLEYKASICGCQPDKHVLVRLGNLERIKLMYAPELAGLDEAARQETVLALATLTSFESWDQLRHCHGLSLEAAQAVWRRAVDRLLPAG